MSKRIYFTLRIRETVVDLSELLRKIPLTASTIDSHDAIRQQKAGTNVD